MVNRINFNFYPNNKNKARLIKIPFDQSKIIFTKMWVPFTESKSRNQLSSKLSYSKIS